MNVPEINDDARLLSLLLRYIFFGRETRKYGGRKRGRQDSKSLTFRRQPLTIVFTFNELFCLLTMPATRKVAYSTC